MITRIGKFQCVKCNGDYYYRILDGDQTIEFNPSISLPISHCGSDYFKLCPDCEMKLIEMIEGFINSECEKMNKDSYCQGCGSTDLSFKESDTWSNQIEVSCNKCGKEYDIDDES